MPKNLYFILFTFLIISTAIFADEGRQKAESKSNLASSSDIELLRYTAAASVVSNIFSGIKSAEVVGLSLSSQEHLANKIASSFTEKDLNVINKIFSDRNLLLFQNIIFQHLAYIKTNSVFDKNQNNDFLGGTNEQKVMPEKPYITNTKSQLRWMIENGYDTDSYDVYSDGTIKEKPEVEKKRADILSKAKWLISVEDGPYRGTWGSEKEPKAFGNGIRFTVVGTGTEIIVNGQFSIRKID